MNSDQKRVLKNMNRISRLMDSQFRIPGTQFRFGLDPLIGFIPGAGDFAGFIVSAIMLSTMARNGASGFVLSRMVLNIIIDLLIGSVPVIGDIFDFAFKSNKRNMKLMHEHYVEGKHKGGAWKVIVPVLLILAIVTVTLGWVVYKFIAWLAS